MSRLMAPVTYIVPGESTSPRFGAAFAAGCGGTVSSGASLEPGEAALFGSPRLWPLIEQALQEQRLIYGDHAYFDRARSRAFRITRNGFQADGRQPASPVRFERLGLRVAPWRTAGGHVLVCPNSAKYFELLRMDAGAWLARTIEALRQHTDREVRVRWKTTVRPFVADLRDAWAVVAFSSTAAIEALVAGVPVFVLAPFAAAARMGSPDLGRIETPSYPDDRAPFLWSLAAQQWTLAEIAAGDAWRALQEMEATCAA